MSETPSTPSERDQRLERILADYLHADEAGRPADREALLRQYPDLAAELGSFFRNRDAIERIAEPIKQQAAALPETIGGSEATSAGVGVMIRYFGDYELLEEIARGGMGVVYRAKQVSLNRIVALKMILAGQFASAVEVQRFHTEAEAAANLDHPNIVPIYEVGEHEGRHYFSMKLIVQGSGVRSQASDQRQAARMITTVARAVHYAHQRGIIHRDLKPANLLVDEQGQPHITDFGLAKRMEGDANLSQSGAIVGTPAYMAPEQAAGKKGLTTAADVYSLGAILYELLTGKPPFVGATPMDILLQVMDKEPTPPRQVQPGIDRDLETVVLKCLEKDLSRRYASAEAVANDLDRWLDGAPIEARPAGNVEKAWKWARRNPAQAALAATILVATAALLITGVVFNAHLQIAGTEIEKQKAQVSKVQAEADYKLADADKRLARADFVQQRVVYVADLDRANRVLKENFPVQGGDLLDKYFDSSLRGWEWHYLKRKSQGELYTVPGQIALAWSPDGKMFATGHDNDIALRDAETGKLLRTLARPNAEWPIVGIAFDKEGKRLVAWTSYEVFSFWDVAGGKLLWELQEPNCGPAVALRPDGGQVATSVKSDHNEVHLRDADTGKITKTLKFPATKDHRSYGGTFYAMPAVRSLAYSPDGNTLAMGIVNGFVILWNSETGAQLSQVHLGHLVAALAFDPATGALYAGDYGSNISILRADDKGAWTKAGAVHVGQDNRVEHLAVASQGGRLLSASIDRVVRLWQVRGNELQLLASWSGHEKSIISGLTFRADGKRFATLDSDASFQLRQIKIWDVANLDIPADGWSENLTASLIDFAASADGKFWAVARQISEGKTRIELCDAVSGKVLWEVSTGPHLQNQPRLLGVAISPDSKRLATRNLLPAPETVQIWDIASRKKLFELNPAGDDMLFSPDGRWFVTMARKNGAIQFWDAVTGKPAFTHQPSKKYDYGAVSAHGVVLAFTPDGRFLALGNGLLFEVHADGLKEVHAFPFPEHPNDSMVLMKVIEKGRAGCLAISPDGHYLAASSWPGEVDLWDLEKRRLHQKVSTCRTMPWTQAIRFNNLWLAFSPDSKNLAYATDVGTVHLWNIAAGQDVLVLDEGRPRDGQRARLFFSKDGNKLFAISKTRTFIDDRLSWDVWNATPLSDEALHDRMAVKHLDSLAKRFGLKAEIQVHLEADAELKEGIRKGAMKHLIAFAEHPGALNDQAWQVVAKAGATAKDYQYALRQVERSCELAPSRFNIHTLGAAYYRVGEHAKAVDSIRKSVSMRPEKERNEGIWDLPFLAMSHHHLGRADQARADLKRFRDLPKGNRDEPMYRALLAEAEQLIEGKK